MPIWNAIELAHGYNAAGRLISVFRDTTQCRAAKLFHGICLSTGGLLSNVDDMIQVRNALAGQKLLSGKHGRTKCSRLYYPDRDQAYGWFVSKNGERNHVVIRHPAMQFAAGLEADFRWYKDDNLCRDCSY